MTAAIDHDLGQRLADFEAGLQLDASLERVLARFRLRAARRAAWLRKLWQEEGEPGDQNAVTHAEIDTHLADRDAPSAEAHWLAEDDRVAELNRLLDQVEEAQAQEEDTRLATLVAVFGLDPREADLFQACLAVALDPTLSRVCAYLHDHAGRGYMSEELAARLFGHGRGGGGILRGDSPLRRWRLVREQEVGPGEPTLLACDLFLQDWLRGEDGLDPELAGLAGQVPPLEPLEGWPVAETTGFLERVVLDDPPDKVLVEVSGPTGSGRRTLAAAVAARLGLPLLAVDGDRIGDADWPRVWLHAQRQAYLERTALAWYGKALERPRPAPVPAFPVQFLILEPDQVAPPLPPELVRHRIQVPAPRLEEREVLWHHHLPALAHWPQEQCRGLARHRVTVGEIATVARKRVSNPEEAAAAVREGQRDRLGGLAQHLESRFGWKDLVVPRQVREVLEDLAFEAGDRTAFWERPEAQRLFPQGRGLLALFSGPPGTGKTMAAQVLAAELGVDLFRIDLSSVISKYVGETSQNLEKILSRARHQDAVLLFDEADALFGKRTEISDAHDRFANTDTNYLLQAVEDYPGMAVLSTNKKGNVDPAFIRRLRYVLEFPRPDRQQRLAIWRRLVGELAGDDRLAGELGGKLEDLAANLELTGAQIKYAVLGAVFAARREEKPLAWRHLLHGVERELMKDGRVLSERERRRLGDGG